MTLRFSKMHGAGNDFVVLDLRGGRAPVDAALARALGDRHRGVGFDQLLTVEDADRAGVVARYGIWNSDGSQARQCGNGARCVAAWLVRDGAATDACFTLDSPAGAIEVERIGADRYALDMGRPEFAPARIPLSVPREDAHYFAEVEGEAFDFGACAAVAVLARQGRVQRTVHVTLPGGELEIAWPTDEDPIRMAGPATFVFEGEFLDGDAC